jgi:hypothetical protein
VGSGEIWLFVKKVLDLINERDAPKLPKRNDVLDFDSGDFWLVFVERLVRSSLLVRIRKDDIDNELFADVVSDTERFLDDVEEYYISLQAATVLSTSTLKTSIVYVQFPINSHAQYQKKKNDMFPERSVCIMG